jgi:hypothetical protein
LLLNREANQKKKIKESQARETKYKWYRKIEKIRDL